MSDRVPIRVLLADDHRILREALRAVLEPECEVVAESPDGETAIALATRHKPDVAVIDVSMPGIGGLAAARRISESLPRCKVLILTQYDDEDYVVEALGEAQLAGYLLKTDAAAELLSAVRAVHHGKRYISPSVAPVVLARLRQHGRNSTRPSGSLTRREREVLRLIAEGASSKDIAQSLKISPRTAQVHRDNLKRKLGLRSTAAMVRYALKRKIIRID